MASIISKIEGFSLECDMPTPVGNARVIFDKRTALLIRITTSDGHVGWGECWAYPAAIAAIIQTTLGPSMIGRDVTEPVAAIAPLFAAAAQDRRGLHHMAISALDIAVWDAYGQVSSRSIASLLGGARRKSIAAYASGPLLHPDDPFADLEPTLKDCLAQGFRAFKLRIGIDRESDLAALRTARRLIGPDSLLAADMNEAGTVKEAIGLVDDAADLRLAWLEEPVPHDNIPAYVQMAAHLPVPLSGGESFYGLGAFRDVLARGGLDLIQPDLALCGGFSEARKIAALGEAFGVPTMLHVWGAGVNYLAALQFSATLPPQRMGRFIYPLHEIDVSYNPLRSAIVGIELDADGCVTVPDGPGLGLKFDTTQFESFVVDRWTIE